MKISQKAIKKIIQEEIKEILNLNEALDPEFEQKLLDSQIVTKVLKILSAINSNFEKLQKRIEDLENKQ